jgi:micrococcal nuclease
MTYKKTIYLLLFMAVIFIFSGCLISNEKKVISFVAENNNEVLESEVDDLFDEAEENNQVINDEEPLTAEIKTDETEGIVTNDFNSVELTTETEEINEDNDEDIIEDEEIISQLKPENCQYHLVTKVHDGDTIVLANGERVRYIGIDTPETVHPSKPVQCFGREASAKNKELVLNQTVCLTSDITDRDKYGRLLRYIWLGNTFINLELVREGYATSYTYPPDIKYQHLFIEAQDQAREQELGLWSACSDEEPIEWPGECPIKGNISTGGKIYHLPGCDSYEKTVIDESTGEKWFCTEAEALNAGWRKALNCN